MPDNESRRNGDAQNVLEAIRVFQQRPVQAQVLVNSGVFLGENLFHGRNRLKLSSFRFERN